MKRSLMLSRSLILVILACLALGSTARAQTPNPTEKRAAIQEVLDLMGASQAAAVVFTSLVDQYSQALAKDTVRSFENKNWPPAFKEKAKVLTQDFYSRLSRRLSEELPQRIRFEEKLTRLDLDVYDDYLTESEIRELIAFYQSPAGRKFAGFGPKVLPTLQQKAQVEAGPEIMSVTRQIIDEELKHMEKRIADEAKASA
ncbi:MAG: DUF2059 domain-containing protein, partial [Pyrinomonadaceae bacterium]